MFNNLIESSSHRREIKRRGSFLLFTTATYALLFAIAGVASIYAYDARLNEQSLEIVTIMPLVDTPAPPRDTPRVSDPAPGSGNRNQNYYERETAMADVDRPIAPDIVSTKPNTNLPLPSTGTVRFTGRDSDPGTGVPGTGSTSDGAGAGTTGPRVANIGEPPKPPEPKPIPKQISKGVITSEAISLPKPTYPPIALQAGAYGRVAVQVLVDEKGNVIAAHVISGHPLLAPAALKAAYLGKFSPTLLSHQPVKVSGMITYNFERR